MKKSKSSSGLLKLVTGSPASSSMPRTSSARPPSSGDSSRASLGSQTALKGISFGHESKAAAGTTSTKSSSSSGIAGLLTGSLSGGLGGGISSLFGASGLGALGSLVSGLGSLFGGGKTQQAALPAFTLPGSQIQNLTVKSGVSASVNLTANTQPGASYQQLPDAGQATQHYTDQSTQIAQAVKTALLQSHSLGDVISEL